MESNVAVIHSCQFYTELTDIYLEFIRALEEITKTRILPECPDGVFYLEFQKEEDFDCWFFMDWIERFLASCVEDQGQNPLHSNQPHLTEKPLELASGYG